MSTFSPVSNMQNSLTKLARFLSGLVLLFVLSNEAFAADDALGRFEKKVDQDFASVRHLTADQLAKITHSDSNVVLFDVREQDEFAVSRIAGALRLDPEAKPLDFLKAHASKLKGKQVVFYCSVGVRSSIMAERMQKALKTQGASGVYNLRGGIFRWHNDKRTLVDAKGQTPFVHPYSWRWGRLVNRRNMTSYKSR